MVHLTLFTSGTVLFILVPLPFHTNIRIIFSIYVNLFHWDVNFVKSIYQFRKPRLFFFFNLDLNLSISPMGFPDGSVVKTLPANSGDMGSTPGLRRSPGERNGNHSNILAWEIS